MNVGGGPVFGLEHLRPFWDLLRLDPSPRMASCDNRIDLVLAGAVFLVRREKALTKQRHKRPFSEGFFPETCVGVKYFGFLPRGFSRLG